MFLKTKIVQICHKAGECRVRKINKQTNKWKCMQCSDLLSSRSMGGWRLLSSSSLLYNSLSCLWLTFFEGSFVSHKIIEGESRNILHWNWNGSECHRPFCEEHRNRTTFLWQSDGTNLYQCTQQTWVFSAALPPRHQMTGI